MMPYELFLEMCATELRLLKELTAQCQERIRDVLDILLSEKQCEYVWMGGCEWLTPPMGSPYLYAELVQNFEQPLIERIHDGGAVCHIHCHGNVRSTLEQVIQRGADYFEPAEPPPDGDITFAEAKVLAAGRITLGGNIEARIIENEPAEFVEAAVRAAFEGGRDRMVLSTSSGPISRLSPLMMENYHRIIDLWEELSLHR
jgi:uroporphyrinogen-III decarboxylase